jgi:hypothetical protein
VGFFIFRFQVGYLTHDAGIPFQGTSDCLSKMTAALSDAIELTTETQAPQTKTEFLEMR